MLALPEETPDPQRPLVRLPLVIAELEDVNLRARLARPMVAVPHEVEEHGVVRVGPREPEPLPANPVQPVLLEVDPRRD
eukprot:1668249-Lingulodinium_polyedra.AAC.1